MAFLPNVGSAEVAVPQRRRRLVTRLVVVQCVVAAAFAALALAFWYFQVVEHDRFREMAENNHQRTLALRAPRGIIFDRDQAVLVENRDSMVISLVREHSRDLDRTIRRLAEVVGVPEATVREAVRRHRSEPSYRPIPIVEDATLAQVAAVTAHRLDAELPEVIVERVPTRRYPSDSLAAHVFGYVSEATEAQLEQDGSHAGDVVGQAGVERLYNKLLMGVDGARRVVVNSLGREIRTLDEVAPAAGPRMELTIDRDVQRAAEEGFAKLGHAGAAVVLDPNTGEVLAYASLPAYDPNAFAGRIDRTTWAALTARRAQAAAGPGDPGAVFARLDLQDGRRAGRARGRRHHAGLHRGAATGARISTAACSSAGSRAATAASICATRSSSRATSTSTRSARWWAWTRSTSGRRAWASASRAGSTCRTR